MIKIPTTKLLVILFVSLLLTTFTASLIQQRVAAQEVTQSSESAESNEVGSDDTVTNNIRQLILDTASKVKGVANSNKRALIGEIQRITDEAITIEHLNGQQIIPLGEALLLENESAVDVEDIAVGNWVTILGSAEESSITTITPDYILVSDDTLKTDPQFVVVGNITEISNNLVSILPRNSENEKAIDILSTTDFEDSEGNPALLSDFEVDMTVLITGFETTTEAEDGTEEIEEVEASTIRSLAPLGSAVE